MNIATLVTGLQNWLYFKKESTEETDFFNADTTSGKLTVTLIIFG